MSDVTRLLDAAASGDPQAAADLLPAVYDELRRLAAARMAAEAPGHTLAPTALVHEAYLCFVGPADDDRWQTRGHFFAAAAEAMRRILVESARRKRSEKHGGKRDRVDLRSVTAASAAGLPADELLDLDEALTALEAEDAGKAALVRLRFFGGLSEADAAACLGLSRARHWAFARAWLLDRLGAQNS